MSFFQPGNLRHPDFDGRFKLCRFVGHDRAREACTRFLVKRIESVVLGKRCVCV